MARDKNSRSIVILTAALSVVAVLLVLYTLTSFVVLPKYRIYRMHHHEYDVKGGMTEELKDCDLYEDMQSGKSFCFIGDSITDGTETDGIRWNEPLKQYINGKTSYFSYPGWTVKNVIDNSSKIPSADVYVIAVGINDSLGIGYASTTAEDFAGKCSQLAALISNINPEATICFIAPWTYVGFDDKTMQRGVQFRNALEEMCLQKEYRYIDPDPVITSVFAKDGYKKYMLNGFHPEAPEGVELFSYAVLKADHNRRSVRN